MDLRYTLGWYGRGVTSTIAEIDSICSINGTKCNLLSIDGKQFDRFHSILSKVSDINNLPSNYISLYFRCMALNFEGIPTPKQMISLARSDVFAYCILMSKTIRILNGNLRSMSDIQNSSYGETLHNYATWCLFNIDVKEPDYETLVEWTKLFQDCIIEVAPRYCHVVESDTCWTMFFNPTYWNYWTWTGRGKSCRKLEITEKSG